MDPTRFGAPEFGRVVRTPGPHGFHTFIPAPVPRRLEIDAETVLALSEADRALGRLAGAGRLLPNPELLVFPYVAREALSSSRIEGTQASLSDVLDAEVRGVAHGDVAEVVNYIRAMRHGLARLPDLPVSGRLLRESHAVLLDGVRGAERLPGELRRSPNWIGSPDNRPETAVFVPPPVDEMLELLADWEHFVNDRVEMPPLVRCALAHYQFETIHPFLDGNGRLGRLLVVFLLQEWGLLPQPLLYLSAYFEARRSDYYDRLQAVRERGALAEWLRFFLDGVATQARDALDRAERLADLREVFRRRAAGTRARLPEVIDLLFENPYVTAGRVQAHLQVTNPGAMNLIRRLADLDVVTELERIPGRSKRWVAHGVLEIIDL
jgi:Fic family protein